MQPNQQPVQPVQAAPPPAPQPGAIPPAQPPTQAQTTQQKQTTEEQPKKTSVNTTQKSLLFSELRDNMIVMNDGSFRAVIACQSINFDLMSNREREGVEYSYQNFLNSLNFDVQILVRSQRVDIAPYIDKLLVKRRQQDNMLLGVLMDDYIDFIGLLAQEANIMDKSFFVVVPYFPAGDPRQIVEKGKGFFARFFSQAKTERVKISKTDYEKAKDEIKNRSDSVMSGLFAIGIQCARLSTKELGELYYNVYNPDTAVNQPLGDFTNNTEIYTRKATGEPPHPTEGGA